MLSKAESLFIVDLESVSLFNEETIINKASDDKEYYKTPFLYLIFSYVRNQALNWADKKYKYIGKKRTGSWMIYKFSHI